MREEFGDQTLIVVTIGGAIFIQELLIGSLRNLNSNGWLSCRSCGVSSSSSRGLFTGSWQINVSIWITIGDFIIILPLAEILSNSTAKLP